MMNSFPVYPKLNGLLILLIKYLKIQTQNGLMNRLITLQQG